MKIKLLAISLCVLFGITTVKGQSENKMVSLDKKRHSIKISVSDGLTLGVASFWGMGLSDAVLGTKRSDQKSSGVFAVGYRYSLSRFRVGLDAGFANVSSKITLSNDKRPSIKEKELNFMILPTVEYLYYKRNLIELYGSASAGVNITRHSETGLTEWGKRSANLKSTMGSQFAYQINPIGIRIGNSCIGGFLEAGLGYRGFITAGVSLNF